MSNENGRSEANVAPGSPKAPGVFVQRFPKISSSEVSRRASDRVHDLKDPISGSKDLEEIRDEKSAQGKYKFIPKLDHGNELAVMLNALYATATTHASCINRKATYACGSKFMVKSGAAGSIVTFGEEEESEAVVADTDQETLKSWLPKFGNKKDLKRWTKDALIEWQKHGEIAIRLVRSDVDGQRAFRAHLLSNEFWVWRLPEEKGAEPTEVLISQRFDRSYLDRYEPEVLPKFPEWVDRDGVQECVYVWQNKPLERLFYSMPEWVSARLDAQIDYRIPSHNFYQFENGFTASAIVQMVAEAGMTQAEAEALTAKMEKQFTGDQNTKRMLIQIVENAAQLAQVDVLDNEQEGDFLTLDQRTEKRIIRGHEWFEILLGNPTSGKLGEVQEFMNTYRIAMAQTIEPMQDRFCMLLNKVVKEGLEWVNGESERDWRLAIVNKPPLTIYDRIDPEAVVTKSEARRHHGLEETQEPTIKESTKTQSNGPVNAD